MTSTLDSLCTDSGGEDQPQPNGLQGSQPALSVWQEPSTIALVGMGYVGLPTALAFLEAGVSVIGYDISESRLAAIKSGQVDLLERDRARLRDHMHHLTLTSEPLTLADANVVVVCVPTPIDAHQVPDLLALRAACDTVVAHAVPGQTIILTSTTFVGCTREFVVEKLEARGLWVGVDVFVAFSPERIDPGNPAHVPELTPRVIGGVSLECTRRAAKALRHTTSRVHEVSSPEAAELTKLLENTFRAVNIALANDFSLVARALDVDAVEVIQAASTKPYGFMPFYPGPGVGGHCIPCDPHYLLWQLKALRIASPVTETAMASIVARPRAVVTRARHVLAESGKPFAGARVLIVGVTYKPGVADIRESPALEIMDEITKAGAQVSFSDPMVQTLWTASGRECQAELDPAYESWDLVIVHTLHPGTDYSWLAAVPLVLDTTYQLSGVPQRHIL